MKSFTYIKLELQAVKMELTEKIYLKIISSTFPKFGKKTQKSNIPSTPRKSRHRNPNVQNCVHTRAWAAQSEISHNHR